MGCPGLTVALQSPHFCLQDHQIYLSWREKKNQSVAEVWWCTPSTRIFIGMYLCFNCILQHQKYIYNYASVEFSSGGVLFIPGGGAMRSLTLWRYFQLLLIFSYWRWKLFRQGLHWHSFSFLEIKNILALQQKLNRPREEVGISLFFLFKILN